MDDRRLGLQIRALRRRRNWRQEDLANAARISQSMVSLAERGHLDGITIRTLRAILAALDARLDLGVRWRGGALDRLIDERHATLANLVVGLLTLVGWSAAVEVSFNHFGDRGSIDVLAFHPVFATLLVIEIKSEITSVEETARRFDVKIRVAHQTALESRGWRARRVAAILVLPEGTAARNALRRFDAIFRTTFPRRGREPAVAAPSRKRIARNLATHAYHYQWRYVEASRPRPHPKAAAPDCARSTAPVVVRSG